jgi:methylthioribulose 1-phosphate dehydratase/enolase-phosphatase E1
MESYHSSMPTCVISVLQVLFATDVLAEAQAAAAAGWRAVLVSRPGNKALPEQPGFRVIESMQQLLTPFTELLN